MTKAILGNDTINQDIQMINDILHPKTKDFNRRDIILSSSSDINMMGILLKGSAYLATINLDYQKRIIDYYEPNDVFCNCFLSVLGSSSYYITAKTKCTVALLDYRIFTEECGKTTINVQDTLLADAMRRSLMHVDILSQRTLRNKLISYFEYCRKRKNSTTFHLPMTFTELADYLAVDRSSMMREIGKMKEDNIIESVGQKITLLE